MIYCRGIYCSIQYSVERIKLPIFKSYCLKEWKVSVCSNKLKVKMQIWRICNIAILQFAEMVQFSGDIPTVRIGWDTRGWCILLLFVCLEFKAEKQSHKKGQLEEPLFTLYILGCFHFSLNNLNILWIFIDCTSLSQTNLTILCAFQDFVMRDGRLLCYGDITVLLPGKVIWR